MSEGCVILAAGQGQRMGQRNKALLALGPQSFLATIAGLCVCANISELIVVVAAPHEAETRVAAQELGLACVSNPHPEAGMGSSVACGFKHAMHSLSAS